MRRTRWLWALVLGAPACGWNWAQYDPQAHHDASVATDALSVTSFTLVLAIPGGPAVPGCDPLPDDASIDLAALDAGTSVRANATGAVVSVRFEGYSDHPARSLAEHAPFYFNGSIGPMPVAWPASPDPSLQYSVTATPFSGPDASGVAGTPATVNFRFVDSRDAH